VWSEEVLDDGLEVGGLRAEGGSAAGGTTGDEAVVQRTHEFESEG
jgi:hypothetical protein